MLELSEEIDESEKGQSHFDVPNHLEQTIIIGEMEEGNIFDDL